MKYGKLYEDIQKLSDKLASNQDSYSVVRSVSVDYNAIRYLIVNELTLVENEIGKKKTQLLSDLASDESKKKIMASSTLASNYINGQLGDINSKYEGLKRLYAGLKCSLDLCRSIMSGIKYEAQAINEAI